MRTRRRALGRAGAIGVLVDKRPKDRQPVGGRRADPYRGGGEIIQPVSKCCHANLNEDIEHGVDRWRECRAEVASEERPPERLVSLGNGLLKHLEHHEVESVRHVEQRRAIPGIVEIEDLHRTVGDSQSAGMEVAVQKVMRSTPSIRLIDWWSCNNVRPISSASAGSNDPNQIRQHQREGFHVQNRIGINAGLTIGSP